MQMRQNGTYDLKEVIYDLQFKQKIYYRYFPFTIEGILLAIFIFQMIAPFWSLNLMESGGIYVLSGLIVYRMFTSKREYDVEHIFMFWIAIVILNWVKNQEGRKR